MGLWSFDQNAWTFIGIQQIVTCRITGINIQKYPLIVMSIAIACTTIAATWDGSVFFRQWGKGGLTKVSVFSKESKCGGRDLKDF